MRPRVNLLGLNAFNFFIAGVQTGFGAFFAVYLASAGWDQGAIGLALSIGSIAGMASQVPGGALVDHIRRKWVACAGGLIAIGLSALVLALHPTLSPVWAAQILHSLGSVVLTPAIASLTLTLCGHGRFGERLGGNARYASLGSAAAALLFGVVAFHLSQQAVFFMTAAMTVPALAVLPLIRPGADECPDDHPALLPPSERTARPWHTFLELHLHTFAVCLVLFFVGNAAMLPIALNNLATHNRAVGLVTSAAVIVPQAVVALFSPWVGRAAHRFGRKPLLAVGFAALPLRGLLFALAPSAGPVVAFELLDGVSGAVLGVLTSLVAADLTVRTGYLNLAIGSFGLAAGLGATFSTTAAGWVADAFGLRVAFLALAGFGAMALVLLLAVMPETRPPEEEEVAASG